MANDIDFFAESAHAADPDGIGSAPTFAASASGRTPQQVTEGDAKKERGWKDLIKPFHFLIVGGVLAVGWVMWPMISGITTNTAATGTPQPTLAAAFEGQQPREIAPVATSLAQQEAAEKEAWVAPGNAEALALEAEFEQQREYQQELLASMHQMNANLVVLMAQVKDLSEKEEVRQAATPTAPARRAIARPPAQRVAEAVPGLKLNTVYPGQAWIDAPGGKTYIAHVGDEIEGARVLSIDEKTRVVETTRGAIR